MRIVFFKRPKPRQFDYKPIYWDEEKEKLEERRKRIERAGKEKTDEEIKEDLKIEIDRKWRRNRSSEGKFHSVHGLHGLCIVHDILHIFH